MKYTELKEGKKYTRDSWRQRFTKDRFVRLPPVLIIIQEDRDATDWRELTAMEVENTSIATYSYFKMTDHREGFDSFVFFLDPSVSPNQIFYYWPL